jgi:hypothetical protein
MCQPSRAARQHRDRNRKSPKLRQRRIKFISMRRTEQSGHRGAKATAGALRDPNPLHEVGWTFRDGACFAVECQGEDLRSRVWAD